MALPAVAAPQTVPSAPTGPAESASGVDYELFLDCVHCGLCLSSCPTYTELGTEADSPRGRIYLMRAVTDGRAALDADVRRHLDLCLDCRACESACPSGVQYGKLIEPFRLSMNRPTGHGLTRLQRLALFHLFPYVGRMRAALAPVRLLQRTRLDLWIEKAGALRLLPDAVRRLYEMLPPLQPRGGRLPEVLPAEGKRRARVALLTGCVADAVYPATNQATARVLQRNGCEVWVPRGQGCCAAIAYHAGAEVPARRLAEANCTVFGRTHAGTAAAVDAIVVNAAGCGAMLKGYGDLLRHTPAAEAAARFARKVRDVTEFLAELGPVPPTHPLPVRATYHDACHLCHAQQVRRPPRQLLEMIPGMELVPLEESELCCGAAGSYNLLQPEMAVRLGEKKVERILATGARAVFAANVGCQMQITRHLRARDPEVWVAHPIDALWASYSGQLPAALRGVS
jgi:glycolate oxidase iron-sulfur subunit